MEAKEALWIWGLEINLLRAEREKQLKVFTPSCLEQILIAQSSESHSGSPKSLRSGDENTPGLEPCSVDLGSSTLPPPSEDNILLVRTCL
jgi:hypothetical protein